MRLDKPTGRLQLSATDLANFLSCRHRTALEMGHARGKFSKPASTDEWLEALFKRGLDHEDAYVKGLTATPGTVVVRVKGVDTKEPRKETLARTMEAMRSGADVIVQGALSLTNDDRWFGYADVLVKVLAPGSFGPWSYEVLDTKLSRETKAGTVLQLALYSMLLEDMQGVRPEHFYVVTPDARETYRVDDYAAYCRLIRRHLDKAASADDAALADENYPEPVAHCDICPWKERCVRRRYADDHLSLVAGISLMQRRELVAHGVETLTSLAGMPIRPRTFTPKRGATETYERVREQARVQREAWVTKRPVYELLPIVEPAADKPLEGLCRLPEPCPGDIFLDLEGDPFVGPTSGPPVLRGREYLFGLVTVGKNGEPVYQPFWAKTAAEEKVAFEAVIDLIMAAKAASPDAHVYHYAPYEPSAFKRLIGRHATRGAEMDSLLRSGAFVDLYAVVRQSLRAGVVRYSIKNLEQFYGYEREVSLANAHVHLVAMQVALQQERLGELKPEVLVAVEGYNRDDCVSTLRLRDWLEQLRASTGRDIPRPLVKTGEASEGLKDWEQRVEVLRGQLLGAEGDHRRVLAFLLDFHRREEKADWWEYFRLLELGESELLKEPAAVNGLTFVADVGPIRRSRIHRYAYPVQEMELRAGDSLKLLDQTTWARVNKVDRLAFTMDVEVGPRKAALRPTAAFKHDHVSTRVIEDAIFAIGEGVVADTVDPLALKLLTRAPASSFDVMQLDADVLPIQGPPGTGKTYTGGMMICDLVKAGKTVGVAATGHKVIHNLLEAVALEARKRKQLVKLAHKWEGDQGDHSDDGDGEDAAKAAITLVGGNPEALGLLTSGGADVLGGTAWLWARPEFAKQVDVLFIDEAGQVSLANALAMTRAAKSLVLLGDPQQLDQPKKGAHPPGVEVSVLEHILGEARTMPADQGVFLEETWRFGKEICAFTSNAFYEGKLRPTSQIGLERQALRGGPIEGAGVFTLEVAHDGNRNYSDEEVAAVKALIDALVAPGSKWVDDKGAEHNLTRADVLVVSPYNVQVSRLAEALPGVRCGTVDKFQGQQAPVSIYSMATSSPEEAPRGMEFLYSLNRLNVATSRAKCAAIVVASPRLFEPECKTPAQVRLASALCWFKEMATSL